MFAENLSGGVAVASWFRAVRGLMMAAALALGAAPVLAAPSAPLGLRAILGSGIPADEPIRAVAMFDHVPTQSDVEALRALGLVAQPMRHLPMVLTKGTVAQLQQAVSGGIARDVYIDQALQWHSRESTAAMSADVTRELGFTGEGIGIAIVDSGIDASHPALEQRVVRNVRVYSPEYLDILGINQPAGITWPSEPALVLPFDDLPYNNTDTIGHGTHVAGIAAGDGNGDPEIVGVAPGASLIGYSTGEVLFIFTAVASFDDILATHEQYNIKVVNNSWGSSYALFDPNAPINVASKALYDAGITVVFSAGNSSEEMTTNPYSMAPWVICSGSATVSKEKSDFSSSGLMFDNTQAAEPDENFHVHFEGDGLGLSHPDTSAPGSNILSAGTPTGVTVTPGTPPGGSATASGTSMSAPHMSGLAAVLLHANPSLTPDQIRQVMQVTSVPMRDGAPFWRSGFGFVDAKQAVDLVIGNDFSQARLDAMQAPLDAQVMAARPYRVLSSDHWMFLELAGSVAGLETFSFDLEVGEDTDAVRASVAFPADLGIVGINLFFEWALTLYDPDGNAVATSELTPVGVGVLHVDFEEAGIAPKPGTWRIEASGELHLAQPALLWGHAVTVSVTQLARQATAGVVGPIFRPLGEIALSLAGGAGVLPSPEGCAYDPTGASGAMSTAGAEAACQAGTVGYAVNYGAGLPAEFVSEPLAEDVMLGGDARLRLYLIDSLQPIYSVAFGSSLAYQIDAIDEAGEVLVPVAGGEFPGGTITGPTPTLGEYTIAVPPTEVPAGSRLRLQMRFSGFYSSTMRLLWGGEFADSGLTLLTGTNEARASGDPGPVAVAGEQDNDSFGGVGALGSWSVLLLCLAALRRRAFHFNRSSS